MDYKFLKTGTSSEQIKAYSRLLSLVFPNSSKFSEPFLKWQYEENPNGQVVGFDAYYGGILAGHYVTIPVSYRIDGTITKGLLSLNTATHPEHRGKGLFTQLAHKTYEEGIKLGFEFVIGVANQNSTHGFLKKLGFYLIAPLLVKTGVGKITYDRNLEYTAIPHWTKSSIHWRLNNPEGEYFENNNGIISKTDKIGFYSNLYQGNHYNYSLASKKPIFMLWMGLAKKLKCHGLFINLPQKMKPSPLNLIFKDLSGNLPILKKDNVLFESIDFDGY